MHMIGVYRFSTSLRVPAHDERAPSVDEMMSGRSWCVCCTAALLGRGPVHP